MTTGTSGHDAAQGRAEHLDQVRPAQVEQQRRLWGRWIQVASVGAAVAVIAVAGGLMLTSRQESSAATLVSATAVPVDVRVQRSPGADIQGSCPARRRRPCPLTCRGWTCPGARRRPPWPLTCQGWTCPGARRRPLWPLTCQGWTCPGARRRPPPRCPVTCRGWTCPGWVMITAVHQRRSRTGRWRLSWAPSVGDVGGDAHRRLVAPQGSRRRRGQAGCSRRA